MKVTNHYDVLLHRHASNPILTAADWPYPAHTVFNAGATRLPDGTTLLLCRVEDRSGLSHLCAARSANGVDGWVIDPEPTLLPDPIHHPEELWGIEDPRITFVDELGRYAIAYTAFGKGGPGVALALTEDFRTFERLGLVAQPDDKDAALLPRRVDGNFALLHRPMTYGHGDIWLSFSPDMRNWGGHRPVLQARRGERFQVGVEPDAQLRQHAEGGLVGHQPFAVAADAPYNRQSTDCCRRQKIVVGYSACARNGHGSDEPTGKCHQDSIGGDDRHAKGDSGRHPDPLTSGRSKHGK